MDLLSVGDCRVTFLPAVRGLVSEGERARRAIEEVTPEAVAVAIGREDLEALLAFEGDPEEAANWEESLYVQGLSLWGEVRKPPPCYLEAVRGARDRAIPVRALDFNDEDYTEAFIRHVTTWDLIFHSKLEKKAETHRWISVTPEDFVIEFDRFINDPEGYVFLERAREQRIASRIVKLGNRHRSLLAIVEYERSAGVRARLVQEGSGSG